MELSDRVVGIVGGAATSTTNAALERGWRALGVDAHWFRSPAELDALASGDVAVARIDVRPTLDGVEPGLLDLLALPARGVRVVNRPRALLAAHDKLLTARRLAAAGLPHPATEWVRDARAAVELEPPVVVKPRFGSWGRDVVCCADVTELGSALAALSTRPWFRRQGALVQELVPPRGHDLRVLVAGGRTVGAIRRHARPGEWRTNYSLGGSLAAIVPSQPACALAVAAVAAIGGDFVGVDLLPCDDGYVVLEVNGAVDFEPEYGLPGEDVYAAIAGALSLPVGGDPSVDWGAPVTGDDDVQAPPLAGRGRGSAVR